MSTEYIKDTVKKTKLDKKIKGFFKDKCLFNSKGKKVKGPGITCKIFIIILALSLLCTLCSAYIQIKTYSLIEVTPSYLAYGEILADIIYSIFIILFMYQMCKICQGGLGIIILCLLNCIYICIKNIIFKDYNNDKKALFAEIKKKAEEYKASTQIYSETNVTNP